jgi:hypothetical protein
VTRLVAAVLAVATVLALAACGTMIVPQESRILTVPGIVGTDMQLEIVDNTGDLVDIRALAGAELAAVDPPRLNVDRPNLIDARAGSTPNEALIVWVSFACETTGQLMISLPNKITITPGPMSGCDAAGIQRALVLTFRGPVNAPELQLELLPVKEG